ncbi:hypothetical protein SK128_003406 [Halocaridina rubra]|uniref:Ionotropic glutamate receptor L-glutamate and glycine-binding domain-containing protein n=1 Tax=Halocaridina rubra TaxID=373956 RepID=A0AAN8ZWH6_HALRR
MTANHSSPCLKLAIAGWDPFIQVTNDTPPYEIKGPAVDVINLIMGQLGYCYTLTRPPDNDWGFPLPNGSWTGSIGMLHRKEVDMSATVYMVTESRSTAIDFSEGVYMGEQTISYVRPTLTSDIAGFVKPYVPGVRLLYPFICDNIALPVCT